MDKAKSNKDKAKNEVLRYLGRSRQEVPEEISALIDECIDLIRSTAKARHVMRVVSIEFLKDEISMVNTDTGMGTRLALKGADIARYLSGCCQATLFAATLGVAADNLVRVQEKTDLTRSLILDACATQLIEEACEEIEAKVRTEAAAEGLTASRRFSPGYGDFPLEIQPDLLAVLGAEKQIGLTCTESLILLPRKSVTAVIGLGKDVNSAESGCVGCAMRDSCICKR